MWIVRGGGGLTPNHKTAGGPFFCLDIRLEKLDRKRRQGGGTGLGDITKGRLEEVLHRRNST